MNKPAMNNRRILIAAVFHFVHPVNKDSSSSRMPIVLVTFTSSSPTFVYLPYYVQSRLDATKALQPLVAKNARRCLLTSCI